MQGPMDIKFYDQLTNVCVKRRKWNTFFGNYVASI